MLAATNVRRWSFPAGGSLSAGRSPSVGGSPSAGGGMVGSIFGLRPRTASGTSGCHGAAEICRGCCCDDLWSVSGGGLWNAGSCVFGMPTVKQPVARAPWSALVAQLCCRVSGVEGELLAEATLQILSARWEAESRLPSVWLSRMACTCCGSRLAQIVRRKSSGTSGARLLMCRRNCDGFWLPISSCERSCLTRCSREVDNRHTSSASSRA